MLIYKLETYVFLVSNANWWNILVENIKIYNFFNPKINKTCNNFSEELSKKIIELFTICKLIEEKKLKVKIFTTNLGICRCYDINESL